MLRCEGLASRAYDGAFRDWMFKVYPRDPNSPM